MAMQCVLASGAVDRAVMVFSLLALFSLFVALAGRGGVCRARAFRQGVVFGSAFSARARETGALAERRRSALRSCSFFMASAMLAEPPK